jgi:hypothetical protein
MASGSRSVPRGRGRLERAHCSHGRNGRWDPAVGEPRFDGLDCSDLPGGRKDRSFGDGARNSARRHHGLRRRHATVALGCRLSVGYSGKGRRVVCDSEANHEERHNPEPRACSNDTGFGERHRFGVSHERSWLLTTWLAAVRGGSGSAPRVVGGAQAGPRRSPPVSFECRHRISWALRIGL